MEDHTLQQFDRMPPADIPAEKCLIASLMLTAADRNDPTFDEVLGIVRRDDFYLADHSIIFDVLRELRAGNRPCDAVILREELLRRKLLDGIGGTAYLGQLLSSVPSAAHAAQYAKIVREKSQLRRLIRIGTDITRDTYAATPDPNRSTAIARDAMTKLAPIACDEQRAQITPISGIMLDVYEKMEAGGLPAVATGITELDNITGGIGLGETVVIAARPSMGKSLLGKQILLHLAMAGIPVAIISLEERRDKIGRNLLSMHATIENRRIRAGQLNQAEWERAASSVSKLSALPIFVLDQTRDILDIQSMISLLCGKHGVKLIMLDYLQRVGGLNYKSRYEEVSKASVMISDAIKDAGAAGIVLAQLNRALETRDDKRPTIADLRDSGQIEQDADGIILLHREDYYHIHEPQEVYEFDHVAELIIAKWRDGERGDVVRMQSELKYQRFVPMEAPSIN